MRQIKLFTTAAILGSVILVSVIASGTRADVVVDNFKWQHNAYNDPSNGGRYTAFLTHGVPETDNVQFRALCTPRGQTAVLAYNTDELHEGHKVVVNFQHNGRNVYAKSGTVERSAQSEGMSGIRFEIDLEDELWRTLKLGSSIQYGLDGKNIAQIHLRGSSQAIERFLSTCDGISAAANRGVDDVDNEENNVASHVSCNAFGAAQSVHSGGAATLHFMNDSGAGRFVMWINYEGQPLQYKYLAAGESYWQQTFAGHLWMFTDGPGNCKEMFTTATEGEQSYSINYAQ